jgi:hypothetical protein
MKRKEDEEMEGGRKEDTSSFPNILSPPPIPDVGKLKKGRNDANTRDEIRIALIIICLFARPH